jgi:glycosyltransferase involved in cell wall biosynthesis
MNKNKKSDVNGSSVNREYVLSIIIPFHGVYQELSNCLSAISKQDFAEPYELIVVESGNDPQVKKTLDSFPHAVIISSAALLNRGRARNVGAEKASSNFLVFLDSDCIPSSNWLSEMFSSYKNNYEIIVGPVINLYPFHPVASIDNLLQFPDFQKHTSSKNITHFSGTNFGIAKILFNKAGRFDEKFIIGEDITFSQSALRNCNGKIYFNQSMIVRHSGRKKYKQFIEHNETFGFYRGYLSLKIHSKESNFKNHKLYPTYFGIKRFIYITVRTIQWNPVGLIRIIFYFPLVVLGLFAWVRGFRKGIQKLKLSNLKIENSGMA